MWRRALSQSYSTHRELLSWRRIREIVELVLYRQEIAANMVYPLSPEMTFADLQITEAFKNMEFNFPKGVDPNQTKIVHFLIEEKTPLAVQIRTGEDRFLLQNMARSIETQALENGLNNPKGIYSQVKVKDLDVGEVRDALTIFYLKLQAEGYCRDHGYTSRSSLTPALKGELFGFLSSANETDQQTKIGSLLTEREAVGSKVVKTLTQVQTVQAEADRILRLYRWGVVGLTTAHLVGFGYMIFWVEWLGWDIIEPLTFSVSTIYALLAWRFYRRHKIDRGPLSIRDRFRTLALSPHRRMHLQALRAKLLQQELELKEVETKLKLAKNRLALSSTILNSFA